MSVCLRQARVWRHCCFGSLGRAVPPATRDCKQAFQRFSGSEAHDVRVYPRLFAFEVLEQARKRVALLEQLISYITG